MKSAQTGWLLLSQPDGKSLSQPLERVLGVTGVVLRDEASARQWRACGTDHYLVKVQILNTLEDAIDKTPSPL